MAVHYHYAYSAEKDGTYVGFQSTEVRNYAIDRL